MPAKVHKSELNELTLLLMNNMATLPPPKRNHSNSQQYGTGLSPSTMFGSIERADLMSIERPRRKRISSIEMMMKALRLEEEQLDIDSDASLDLSTGSKQKVCDPRDIKQGPKMIRRSKSNEDSQATRRRILAESLATAKTIRINNCESKSTQEEHEDEDDEDEESVHESIMASIMHEGDDHLLSSKSSKTSTGTIKTAASETPEEIYHDSRDSLHELTMEIIRNEQAERAKVAPKRISSGLKIPSANFESSLFIEEDGLMLLKARTSRKNRHADNSQGINWRHKSFNASSA